MEKQRDKAAKRAQRKFARRDSGDGGPEIEGQPGSTEESPKLSE